MGIIESILILSIVLLLFGTKLLPILSHLAKPLKDPFFSYAKKRRKRFLRIRTIIRERVFPQFQLLILFLALVLIGFYFGLLLVFQQLVH